MPRPKRPLPQHCSKCGRPMYRSPEPKPSEDAVTRGGNGMCSTDYQRALRMGRTTPRATVKPNVPKPSTRAALARDMGAQPWADRAACVNADPELFFYADEERMAAKASRDAAAKAVCQTCPVIDECLQWALDVNEPHGVWGGLAEDERRALTRRRDNARRRVTHQQRKQVAS